MPYATETDITDLYGSEYLLSVADRDGDGSADTGVVDEALARADGEIDSYLAAKYDLPLATEPAHLVQIAVDIAVYRMAATADSLTDEIRERYNQAVKWLRDVAKGVVSLGLAEPTESIASPVVSSRARLFTRSTLDGLL